VGLASQLTQDARDVTGMWDLEVVTSAAGDTEAIAVLKQNKEQLSGRYISTFGEADLKGTVKWPRVEFVTEVESGTRTYALFYTGELKAGVIEGTIRVEPGASGGHFTAHKRAAQ
jgi:hypothetical protein